MVLKNGTGILRFTFLPLDKIYYFQGDFFSFFLKIEMSAQLETMGERNCANVKALSTVSCI